MPADHKPNFTGVWELDAAKSRMLGRPVTRMLAKIDHRDPALAQTVLVIDASGGKQLLKFEFLTSGEASVNRLGAGEMRTRAS